MLLKHTPTLLHRANAAALALALALALPAALQAQAPQAPDQPQLNLPRLALSFNMHRIDAQVASTPAQRQIGLMFRASMPQHEGMLFIFEQAGVQCFWMKNTPLPLTAAFLADDGTVVNLADMQPLSTEQHCSAQPVRYVLEMNQGWFAQRGIAAGMRLHGQPFENGGAGKAQP
ncbi:MAG: DUF192 domain-containing protein [Comamonadaceae bacterium]|nr:DUF192 domain-containing protein [Comamonadaceae bacterium]